MRSLNLCAIGLGQGGANLAAEWARRDNPALLINTAASDARGLKRRDDIKLDDDAMLFIGQDGVEGAGRDPTFGAVCIENNAERIRDAVNTRLSGADGVLLCAGLGGGTGSAIAALVEVLRPLELPLVSVCTLPSTSESGISKVNAIKATARLIDDELNGRMFIDNARLVDAFPDLDVVTYYPEVNARALAPLDELNRLSQRDDLWSIRAFDGEDFRKVLLGGGLLAAHVEAFDDEITSQLLVDAVSRCVDGGGHLATGASLEDIAYSAVVLVGPEDRLRGMSFKVFDDAMGALKTASGGGAVYEGIYVDERADNKDAPVRAYVLTGSFHLPTRIRELMTTATSEGRAVSKKVHGEISLLDAAPVEDIVLHRSPDRRSMSALREAPPPRSLTDAAPAPETESFVEVDDAELTHVVPTPQARAAMTRESILSGEGQAVFARTAAGEQKASPADVVYAEAAAQFEERVETEFDDNETQDSSVAIGEESSEEEDLTLGSLAQRYPIIDEQDDDEVSDTTHAERKDDWRSSYAGSSELMSVIESATEVQRVFEDLVDRFRASAEKTDKERVARRLIDDARAKDVEVRALAVWAMVKLEDRGFRRALAFAAKDKNFEIARLANNGLERLGITRPKG